MSRRPASVLLGIAAATLLPGLVAARPARAPAGEPRTLADAEARCGRDDLRACLILGRWTAAGERGVTPDADAAAVLFTRVCEGGEPRGCTALGEHRDAHRATAAADELYTRACTGGDGDGCWHLARRVARAYQDREELRALSAQRTALFQKAESQLERACRRGDLRDCVLLGHLRARARRDGYDDAIVPDDRSAAALYRRACTGGFGAGCSALGAAHEEGRGVKRSERQARALYRRACDLGDESACDWEAGS